MRVVDGKLQQVEISALDDIWEGTWKYTDPRMNLQDTTEALVQNMMAGGGGGAGTGR